MGWTVAGVWLSGEKMLILDVFRLQYALCCLQYFWMPVLRRQHEQRVHASGSPGFYTQ